MRASNDSLLGWPAWLVEAVRGVKAVFQFVNHQTLLGLPLDWFVRAAGFAVLHVLLGPRIGRGRSAAICTIVLLAKEAFDCLAVLDPTHPRAPGWDDAADIASGLLGIALGEAVLRLRSWRIRNRSKSV